MPIVTLTEVKDRVRLGSAASSADALLTNLINGVEAFLQKHLGVLFTSTASLEERCNGGGRLLYLSNCPVTAVASVVDMVDGETVDSTTYFISGRRAVAKEVSEFPWNHGIERYKVTYTAGHSGVPADVKQVALSMIARAYFNPDQRSSEKEVSWASVMDEREERILNACSYQRFC